MDIKCPKCGSITTIRTRNKDGRKFYVCVRYPKCKGKVEQEWDEERVMDSQEEQPKKRGVKPSRNKKPIIVAVVIVSFIVIAGISAVVLSGTTASPSQREVFTLYDTQETYTIKMNHSGTISGFIIIGADERIDFSILDPLGHNIYWNYFSGLEDFSVEAPIIGTYTLVFKDNTIGDDGVVIDLTVWCNF